MTQIIISENTTPYTIGYIIGYIFPYIIIAYVVYRIIKWAIKDNKKGKIEQENNSKKEDILSIDIGNIVFVSNNHVRYNQGVRSNADNRGATRVVCVEGKGSNKFEVSIRNMIGDNPLAGNLQMTPKPMKIINRTENTIELRGYGKDEYGDSYSDYGIILYMSNGKVEKITLIMWDREVKIEYLKN